MEIKSNIPKIIEKLKSIAQNAQTIDFSKALEVGVNAAMGQMKYRVFNTGKDAKGVPFGKYVGKRTRTTNRKFRILKYGDVDERVKEKKKLRKGLKGAIANEDGLTEYEKERIARGRQIQYKDLEMTGTLRRGIVIVRKSNVEVIASIPNERNLIIAKGQQRQISKIVGSEVNIFGLSDQERQLMRTNVNEALKELYARIFNS